MLWMVLIMLISFWLVSRFANKQQQKALEEQKRRTAEALVVGNWVKTRAGFYGTVVEVDGDVVTLATPLGDESLWDKGAILGAEEPPFASAESAEGDGTVEGDQDADVGVDDGAESGAQTAVAEDEDPRA